MRSWVRSSFVSAGLFLAAVIVASESRQAQETRTPVFKPRSDFVATASQYMQTRVRVTGFSGAVLVAHSGRPLLRAAYGLADRTFDVMNTPETKFRLGSVTKSFTAAAVLLLESRNQLTIDDPVSRYVPNWPAGWGNVTIRHLLNHTAGLPRLTTAWPFADVSALSRAPLPVKPRSILDLATPAERSQPLDFTPGERFAYSNVGYVLLGEIIERISGKPFATFMQEALFQPAGMMHTGAEDPLKLERHLAKGYARANSELVPAAYVDLRLVGGAGALHSTVDDLLLWDKALAAGRLLPPAVQDRMFTAGLSNYALGWWVENRFGRRVQWHRGNVQGFVSIMVRYPDEQLFLAVQSNIEGTQVLAVANGLAAMAFGLPYETPRERTMASLDLKLFDRLAGNYSNVTNANDVFVFRRDGERLRIEFPGAGGFDVFAESPTQVFARALEWDALFVVDNSGHVTEVRMRNQGMESRWRPSK